MIRKLSALASLAFSLLVTGTASPGTTPESGKAKLLFYLFGADVLLVDPPGLPPPLWVQRSVASTHLIAPPPTQFPPSPCRIHAFTWNQIVLTIPEPEAAVAADGSSDFEQAYNSLSFVLGLMAISQCNLEIVRDTSTNPDRVLSIRPVP